MNPVHSPAPLSTAPPAGTGRLVGVLGEHQAGDAGAGDQRLVAMDRDVPEADSGDVEDGVGRAGRQRADSDPSRDIDVTRARHAAILPEPAPNGWDADAVRIPVVWSPDTKRHQPKHEVWVGVPTPGTELPERVDAILRAVETHPLHEATPHDDRFLDAVHDAGLLAFLAGAADAWAAGPYDELVGQDRVVPYFFQTAALLAGMTPSPPAALHAQAGEYCYDTMTLVGPGTWEAARAAVDVALTAVDLVLAGERAAYALCRPPGHHVTPLGYGGSCYLNNAAVAAEALRAAGHERVAVIDIDAHHGNGTQAVFWERADVRYGSLHVDPAAGWFPHVFGHAGETGAGAGVGATRNLPLPEGTGDGPWVDAVAQLG